MHKLNASNERERWSCEKVFYDGAQRLVGKTILDHSWEAHAAECDHIVLRCGEHSNPCMYVVYGALLVLEKWSVVVV